LERKYGRKEDYKVYLDELEKRLRGLISLYCERLMTSVVPLPTSRQSFVSEVVERVKQVDEIESYALGTNFAKSASVAIDSSSVHDFLYLQISKEQWRPFWDVCFGGPDSALDGDGTLLLTEVVSNTHVTMAHFNQMEQAEMRRRYASLNGTHIKVTATAFLWGENAAALAVDLASVNDSGQPVPPSANDFVHLTVWYPENGSAFDSNHLPRLVAHGEASRIDFNEPLELSGTIVVEFETSR
jgi:hypothetical protein